MDRLKLVHELAKANKSQRAIAAELDVSQSWVSEFKRKFADEIDEHRQQILEQMVELSIREQEWRLRELQFDVEMLRGWRSPAAVTARMQVLKHVAEELGQMPERNRVVVIPVQHVVEGVDMRELE